MNVAPDIWVLLGWLVVFVIGLFVFENKAMLDKVTNGLPTISKLMHDHIFAVMFGMMWFAFGTGSLFGHFISGPIYCGTALLHWLGWA